MDKQERTFWEKLRHSYRLVIMNNETFEEVGSYKLSMLNFYILLGTIAGIVAILMWMLITYTPLKEYIPGYRGAANQELIGRLVQEVDELEQAAAIRDNYIKDITRLLTGKAEIEDTVVVEEQEFPDSMLQVEPSEEERKFRREMQLEEIEFRARQPISTNQFVPLRPLEEMHFIPPVSGEISNSFDVHKSHLGVDLIAPKNTAVKAVLDGFVFFKDFTINTGNVIGVQHTNNTVTFYKHNSRILREVGSFVKAGEAIAVIGNTGIQTDGPHLHFELWHNGQAVDPEEYIEFR